MSLYTTEVRNICSDFTGTTHLNRGYKDSDKVIEKSAPLIFDFDFPIFDEAYRLPLEKKIIRHFYMREICEETIGLWQFRLNMRMNEIMPYYNQLYESQLLKFNPFYDVDLSTTHTKTNDGTKTEEDVSTVNETFKGTEKADNTKTGKVDATNKSSSQQNDTVTGNSTNENSGSRDTSKTHAYSDTPQGSLENVEKNAYLTNASKDNEDETVKNKTTVTDKKTGKTTGSFSESKSETNTASEKDNKTTNNTRDSESKSNLSQKVNNTEDYIQKVIGKSGGVSYAKLLSEFRSTFLNIDMMIINDLNDLFIGLWN